MAKGGRSAERRAVPSFFVALVLAAGLALPGPTAGQRPAGDPSEETTSHQIGHLGRSGEEVDAPGRGRGVHHHDVPPVPRHEVEVPGRAVNTQ